MTVTASPWVIEFRTWSLEVGRAIAFVERVSHLDVEPPRPPTTQGRALRRHFYDALSKQLCDMMPQLTPSGQDDESQALHVRALLAWYVASPDTHLPRGPFRLAWATHLSLPVFALDQRCAYRPLATGRACSAALGHHGVHVHTCAFGHRQRRDSAVRDAWASLIKAAQWRYESNKFFVQERVHSTGQLLLRLPLTTPCGPLTCPLQPHPAVVTPCTPT